MCGASVPGRPVTLAGWAAAFSSVIASRYRRPPLSADTEEVAGLVADHPGQRTVVIPKPAERAQRRRAPGRHRHMRFVRKAGRGAGTVLAMAVAATASMGAGTPSTVPPVFAPSKAGSAGLRLALLSSRTGTLLRWLTPQPQGATDAVLSVRDGWEYFVRYAASGPAIWRVRVTAGLAQLVQAGAGDYAVSPDGRAVAYVITTDHGDVVQAGHADAVELVARNLVTGRRSTIIMATNPDHNANNWPPGVFGLTWAPDDVHLAVQFQVTAAVSSVLVFDAFTATAIGDGRTAPT